MNRRSFISGLAKAVALSALAVHSKFGSLAPILEEVPPVTTTITGVTNTGLFVPGDKVAFGLHAEVFVITKIDFKNGIIDVRRGPV